MRHGMVSRVLALGLCICVPVVLVLLNIRIDAWAAAFWLLMVVLVGALVGGLRLGSVCLFVAAGIFEGCLVSRRLNYQTFSGIDLSAIVGFLIVGFAMVLVVERLIHAKTEAELRGIELDRKIQLVAPVVEDAPIGVAVYDTSQRFIYVNRALAQWHGVAVEDHMGRTVDEVVPDGGLDDVPRLVRQVLDTGKAQRGRDVTARFNGAERNLMVSRYPIRAPEGHIIGVADAVVDVTDRKRLLDLEAETVVLRKTAELVEKYEAAQKIAGLTTWEADLPSGSIVASPELLERLGTARPGGFWHVLHPDDRATVEAVHAQLIESGTPYQVQTRMCGADGKTFTAILTGQVFRDEAGTAVRAWGTVQDVTEYFDMKDAARRANQNAAEAMAALEAEHAALQLVQRSMLPATVPSPPGAEVAVAYESMGNVTDIGGDWYDAFVLPDGRLAVAVGDVAGHDLRAATVMGQVRNAVRAYAFEDPRPGTLLRRINALLFALPEEDLVTMAYGVYDPAVHDLVLGCAGHPPPLLRSAAGTRLLTEPRGTVLGALPLSAAYAERTLHLEPGDSVLFYTDGLVERRGADTVVLTEQVRTLMDAMPRRATAQDIVTAITERMVDPVTIEDDTCLLLLRRAGTRGGGVFGGAGVRAVPIASGAVADGRDLLTVRL